MPFMKMSLHDQIATRHHLGVVSHMTHFENLELILQSGSVLSKSALGEMWYKSIAIEAVQDIRATKRDPIWNRPIHDYVPLYFADRTPMSAVVQHMNEHILFLRFKLEVLLLPGSVFTDGNAASASTKFFEYKEIDSLSVLDVRVLRSPQYRGDDERKRKKQAEILVPDRLDLSQVFDIVCYSDSARAAILKVLGNYGKTWEVQKNPGNWYFTTPVKG